VGLIDPELRGLFAPIGIEKGEKFAPDDRNLDARILFHHMATVISPAMVNKMVGAGSQYALLNLDKNGNYMDGSKTYKLNFPANVPAKDFWSIAAYDPQTRSQLQTGQPFPGRNNHRHELDANKDGSIDLYFAPKGITRMLNDATIFRYRYHTGPDGATNIGPTCC